MEKYNQNKLKIESKNRHHEHDKHPEDKKYHLSKLEEPQEFLLYDRMYLYTPENVHSETEWNKFLKNPQNSFHSEYFKSKSFAPDEVSDHMWILMDLTFDLILHYGYIYGGFIRDIIGGIDPSDLDIHIGRRKYSSKNCHHALMFCWNLKNVFMSVFNKNPIISIVPVKTNESKYFNTSFIPKNTIVNYQVTVDLSIITKSRVPIPFVIEISVICSDKIDYDVNSLIYSKYSNKGKGPHKIDNVSLHCRKPGINMAIYNYLCCNFDNKQQIDRQILLNSIEFKKYDIIKTRDDIKLDGDWKTSENSGYWVTQPKWIKITLCSIDKYYENLLTSTDIQSIMNNIKKHRCVTFDDFVMVHRTEKMKYKGWKII